MSLISVIIPVYNVEKYLRECLDSVINQTFNDIEIICVNDGSTDASREILEEYKQKDNRIIIIDKVNGGLSSARNAGMAAASGEFIAFIDSDDIVDITMLEKLYKNITSLNTDIAFCAVELYDESKADVAPREKYFSLEYFDKSFDYRAFSYKDTLPFICDVCVTAWNKLYRHSFLKKCNAYFPHGYIFEDGPFFFSIFFKTKKVSLIRDFLYTYRINRKGSIIAKAGRQVIDIIGVVNLMLNSIKEIPEFDDIKYDFYKRKAADIIYRYDLLDNKFKFKFSEKVKNECLLFDEEVFDFCYLKNKMPVEYLQMCAIRNKTGILSQKLRKLHVRFMYKVIQILCSFDDSYFFKFWNFSFKIRKKKVEKLFNVWYQNDKIFFVLFNSKIKFDIDFRYSVLEPK